MTRLGLNQAVVTIVLLTFSASVGCSTVHTVPPSPEGDQIDWEQSRAIFDINRTAVFETPKVKLADGRSVKVAGLEVVPDSMFYFYSRAVERQQVSWSQIETITFVDHGGGAIDGFKIGFVTGAVCGAFIAYLLGSEGQTTEIQWGSVAVGAGIAVFGSVLGSIVGVGVGHRHVYRF
jgi:hypothetical protein